MTVLLVLGGFSHAEDNLGDQLRRALEKAKGKIGEVAEKAGDKGRQWYRQAKENLKLSKPEYLKRAGAKLKDLDERVAVLHEMSSAPGQREYFKTRVIALEQHVVFAKGEIQALEASETEAAFRAKQSHFNKTVWTLEAAVEQAEEEAGV